MLMRMVSYQPLMDLAHQVAPFGITAQYYISLKEVLLMTNIWTGSGVWEGWRLTTNHAASSYNQPVLVNPEGEAFGPDDIYKTPDGMIGNKEICDLLGWRKQQLNNYIVRGVFIEPAINRPRRKLWEKSKVVEFAKEKGWI